MDVLNRTKLEQLMLDEQQNCVSIFIPTHQTGAEIQQDPIRLKNQLKEAEKLLSAQGVSTRNVQAMLEPASTLLQDSDFWQHQSDGLAIFLSSNGVRLFRLPLNFKELTIVADHFYIKPLLPIFTGDGHFFILAVSQNHIRLLNGTRTSVNVVEIGEVAGSMDETLPTDIHQGNLQLHSSGSGEGTTGDSSVTFHGQGGGSNESAKNDLLRYFHLVDDSLGEFLQGDSAPLVLAGVEYLLPIYKEANTYPNLIDMVITGNPDLMSAEELHKSAWDILESLFQVTQEEAFALYQQLAGQASERAANTLERIIPAAVQGRVETLFLAAGVQLSGVYNPSTNEIILHDQPEPGDEYLLDLVAVQTYLKGGTIYVVEPEKMPVGTCAAAVLRY